MFTPKFNTVQSLDIAADMINLPHEDYPIRVDVTLEALQTLSAYLNAPCITEYMIKVTHQIIMGDTDHAGRYRTIDVKVGNDTPPSAFTVPMHMFDLHPITIQNVHSLVDWYTHFQIIHPFQDGNGRVGGTFVAAVSYKFFDCILAPIQ